LEESRLLYLAIMKHQNCIETRVGQRVDVRVTMPSLNRRPGVHPFTAIAHAMGAVDDTRLALVPAQRAVSDRVVSARQFAIVPKRSLAGQQRIRFGTSSWPAARTSTWPVTCCS
jgi:hypothetical protein